MKVYAIDFDGTLSLDKFPHCGLPNTPLINLLKKLMEPPVENRNTWFVLYTSREGEYLEQAVEWLKKQGLVFDSVNSVPPGISNIDSCGKRKLVADLYVDDRAVTPEKFLQLHGRSGAYTRASKKIPYWLKPKNNSNIW
jgi:hypothetical protein